MTIGIIDNKGSEQKKNLVYSKAKSCQPSRNTF